MTQTISKTKQVELTEKHIEVMENFEKLLESGIANQTMSDIASTLKVSLRTLYEIAPSKEELIISTIDRILTNTAKQAFSAIKDVSSPLNKLRIFTEIGNEAVGPKTKKFEVDLRKIRGAQQMIDFHQNAYIRQINKLLQEAIKAKEIELIDSQAVAMILGGIAQEYSKPEIVMQLNQSPEASANMITDLIIRGISKEKQ